MNLETNIKVEQKPVENQNYFEGVIRNLKSCL